MVSPSNNGRGYDSSSSSSSSSSPLLLGEAHQGTVSRMIKESTRRVLGYALVHSLIHLHCSFSHSSHSLTPHCSFHSRALLRSYAGSLMGKRFLFVCFCLQNERFDFIVSIHCAVVTGHCGANSNHFETSIIHCPTSLGVSKVSK